MATPTDFPLVSIVVPVFEAERHVRESLDSILGQTYPNLEVLVMDDASTDGSAEVAAGFDDPRLQLHRNERNLGQFANVNTGIRLARGELIAIHHADDVYERDLLAEQVRYLEAVPEAGAVFALDSFIGLAGAVFGRVELPAEFRDGRLLRYPEILNGVLRYGNTFLRANSSLVRQDVYRAVGLFDDTYDLRADLEMWLRISRSYPIAIVDRHLVRYRWGHENVSGTYERLRTEPELTFALIDDLLRAGDLALAERDSLEALEGRRAEDLLIVAANLYTLERRPEGRSVLARVKPRRLLASRQVQRVRLVVLWAALHILLRLPRVRLLAGLFDRRWGRGRGR